MPCESLFSLAFSGGQVQMHTKTTANAVVLVLMDILVRVLIVAAKIEGNHHPTRPHTVQLEQNFTKIPRFAVISD